MDVAVVYGDFNCELSRIASAYVDALAARHHTVEWRAVRAGPRQLHRSRIVGVVTVRSLPSVPTLVLPEPDLLAAAEPPPEVDTSLAVAALAAFTGDEANALRAALFHAHWVEHRDISDPQVLEDLVGRPVARLATRARHWQRAWEGFADHAVPLVQLTTGYVFRRADALEVLADALNGRSRRPSTLTNGDLLTERVARWSRQ